MSHTARKARKRAGIPFTRTPKVGTPITERATYAGMFQGVPGTRHALELMPRSRKKRDAMLAARGIAAEPTPKKRSIFARKAGK